MSVSEDVSPLFDRTVAILVDLWCVSATRAVVALVTTAEELNVQVADLVELVSAHEVQAQLTGVWPPGASAPDGGHLASRPRGGFLVPPLPHSREPLAKSR